MIQALPVAPAIRFHLSLNVSDLNRSLAFYRTLFGVEPAKRRADYAKFELDDPPLVLSLEPTPRAVGGPLNHLGFRMPDAAVVDVALEGVNLPQRVVGVVDPELRLPGVAALDALLAVGADAGPLQPLLHGHQRLRVRHPEAEVV